MFVDKRPYFCVFFVVYVIILSTIVFFLHTYPPKKWEKVMKKLAGG